VSAQTDLDAWTKISLSIQSGGRERNRACAWELTPARGEVLVVLGAGPAPSPAPADRVEGAHGGASLVRHSGPAPGAVEVGHARAVRGASVGHVRVLDGIEVECAAVRMLGPTAGALHVAAVESRGVVRLDRAEVAAPVGIHWCHAANREAVGVQPAQESDPSADAPHSQASAELKAIVEALIFASPEPLTRKAIDKLLISEPKEDIEAAIAELKRDYDRPGGLQLVEVAGGYQITTRQNLHEWVRRLFHERTTQKLTVQALETLAVIAYKQPITAVEITEIRGVNTSGVVNTLLERHLVKIVSRKRVVGRPFLYATTKEFLIRFGLKDLHDLPKIEDMAEALGFDPPAGLMETTPREDMLPLDEGEPESEKLEGQS